MLLHLVARHFQRDVAKRVSNSGMDEAEFSVDGAPVVLMEGMQRRPAASLLAGSAFIPPGNF